MRHAQGMINIVHESVIRDKKEKKILDQNRQNGNDCWSNESKISWENRHYRRWLEWSEVSEHMSSNTRMIPPKVGSVKLGRRRLKKVYSERRNNRTEWDCFEIVAELLAHPSRSSGYPVGTTRRWFSAPTKVISRQNFSKRTICKFLDWIIY